MHDLLAIKKIKVWLYTFSEGSAPLSFSDRLNKGRYQSCHGLSGVVGTKNVTNQSCLCVHLEVNNIKWKNRPARPANAKTSLVIVKIKIATRKRWFRGRQFERTQVCFAAYALIDGLAS